MGSLSGVDIRSSIIFDSFSRGFSYSEVEYFGFFRLVNLVFNIVFYCLKMVKFEFLMRFLKV